MVGGRVGTYSGASETPAPSQLQPQSDRGRGGSQAFEISDSKNHGLCCACLSALSGKCTSGGDSLVVQWLGLSIVTAEGLGSISGWGTKIPPAITQPKNEPLATESTDVMAI